MCNEDFICAVGTRIDFGDPGVGVITARDDYRVFMESPVFTGWVEEEYLRSILLPIEGDGISNIGPS